ncbi:carbon-nitrogen hydrolase family protein [Ancylobacter dichloromethanicus]|uniref:Hydrolase n=1 Tax=Ancylobacter dichloromethanicus TaxID=518825 RepID=A0A9W6J6R8_9HYPH|nr:carbon-nitrogen hydrolase family protein [Ancylobacter dichloromethanicus]MBS7554268.1 carbon-nitrogen hydrolase family protein [Ancylobacter dichloromethanicus]GLK71392.1 hydrolase [Ancylobacter dichloromethanicus]
MRLALFQTAGDPSNDPAANLERLDAAAAAASQRGADLLVAPEMFLTGYNIGRHAARTKAETFNGPSARRAASIARAHNIGLCYGYPEFGGGTVYNSCLLLGRDGTTLLNYRKTHLFGDLDRAMFTPGEGSAALADFAGYKVGMLICYDVEFPEAVRALALAGADLVLVPTANMKPYDAVSYFVVPSRAFENELFVAYANRCGAEGELDYMGLSCVGDPMGGNLVLGSEGEELLFADLGLDRLREARALNTHVPDRRPEVYARLIP